MFYRLTFLCLVALFSSCTTLTPVDSSTVQPPIGWSAADRSMAR